MTCALGHLLGTHPQPPNPTFYLAGGARAGSRLVGASSGRLQRYAPRPSAVLAPPLTYLPCPCPRLP
eukprot:scaffold84760_cov78-Phaeocystis_antarctica.AAC.4